MRRPVAIMCPPSLLCASEVSLAAFDPGAVTTPAELVGRPGASRGLAAFGECAPQVSPGNYWKMQILEEFF
jgi:hypothetical protein